jgi:hypothetical protein
MDLARLKHFLVKPPGIAIPAKLIHVGWGFSRSALCGNHK